MDSDQISHYTFELPEELIAQSPSTNPEDARLLVIRIHPEKGLPRFEDLKIADLPDLAANDPALQSSLWVRNRSAVLPARFYAKRPSGSRHEIVLLEPTDSEEKVWTAMVRGSSDFKYPQRLLLEGTSLECVSPSKEVIDFSKTQFESVNQFLSSSGEMPLPPYIKSRKPSRDKERYQPFWADLNHQKSVAAPTASLHFSKSLLDSIENKAQIDWADLILDVGLGTFAPLRVSKITEQKELHAESFKIRPNMLKKILEARGQITAIGTTTLRCLEALSDTRSTVIDQDEVGGISGSTKLFLKPGNPLSSAKNLMTNFHLPESSLFLLICAFAKSTDLALEAYKHAISKKYRFFSYGDATLWIR